MPKRVDISDYQEDILDELLNPRSATSVEDIAYLYDCTEIDVTKIGNEYGLDWEARAELIALFKEQERLRIRITRVGDRLYQKEQIRRRRRGGRIRHSYPDPID